MNEGTWGSRSRSSSGSATSRRSRTARRRGNAAGPAYDGGVVSEADHLNRWVEVTSTTPAKIMGCSRRGDDRGRQRRRHSGVGSAHDLHGSPRRHTHACRYNPYEGRRVKGKALVVLSRGEVVVEKDKFLGKKGRGKFIKRGSRSCRLGHGGTRSRPRPATQRVGEKTARVLCWSRSGGARSQRGRTYGTLYGASAHRRWRAVLHPAG